MSITDLTGTTWVFNTAATWTEPSSFTYFRIDGGFYEGETLLTELSSSNNIFIKSAYFGYGSELGTPNRNIYPAPIVDPSYAKNKWRVVLSYRVGLGFTVRDLNDTLSLTITGGTDATNADLISWLESNATLQTPSAPRKSVDLTTLAGWSALSSGTHNITIVAKANGFKDSAPSAAVQVEKAAVT